MLAGHVLDILRLKEPEFREEIPYTISKTANEYIGIYRKFAKKE